jgi:predicted ATPase/DNA-binding CsgD family transcriptional regulator
MAVTTSTRRPRNLPVDLTSFVGREREIATAKGLLASARLVTFTGPGGVGKTRLALRTASAVNRGFRDGVWFAELAGLHDAALVPQSVATALGIEGVGESRPQESLVSYLEERQLLLVLDNCEHLVDACTILADSLLRSCPELRILATSRQPLRVDGEHTLPVPPLPVPVPDSSGSAESLGQYPAVQLFVERAAAVQPGFAVDERNRQAVAEVCRRLDGIPLAIELAAGRLRGLTVDQLHDRLDDRYGLLTGGRPAALPRQQTLRALIDWSFELCSPSEQQLWSRLSVFGDGFELDAAEQVCSDDEVPAAEVFPALAGLIEKSVVTAEQVDQRMRYHLSETLREYGHGRLSEGDEHALRRKHRDWCGGLVSEASARWFSGDQVELFARLWRELANIRSALGFCLEEPGEAPVGLLMASSLRFYWVMIGSMAEGRHWLERLLAHHPKQDAARLMALRVDGHLATLLNDYDAAEVLLAEARTLADQLDDGSAAANVTQVCGLSALFQSDTSRAAALFEEALEEHRALDDRAATAYDGVQLALATVLLGDHDRALELIEDALRTCEPSGDNWVTSLALFALGVESCRSGDPQRATDAERESIRLRLPLHDKRSIGLNFEILAWTAAAADEHERSARLFGAAQAVQESIGTSLRALGHLAELHDRYEPLARRALGDAAFERQRQTGLLLEFDEAVEYALGAEPSAAVRPPSPAVDPAAAAGLTKREWEIAELVARGMSNREIAATLVISQRTAEGHVEHIFTKLNFNSRSQVAFWMAEQQAGSQ